MNSTSPLLYYFKLQITRILRLLKDNGLYPIIVIPFLIALFIICSIRLLSSFDFGDIMYAFIGISLSGAFAQTAMTDFLKRNLNTSDFQWIRLGEPIIKMLPFIGFLLFYGFPYIALSSLGIIVIGIYFQRSFQLPSTFPTPFSHRPFEFARGFRNSIIPIIGIYILLYLGISANNFNLSIATIGGMALVCAYYFVYPEPQLFVWLHKMSPNQFLITKTKMIVIHFSILVCPIIITMILFAPHKWLVTLLVVLASIMFIELCMLTKYTAYPTELNIIQGMAIGFSILLPPIMIIAVPFFYRKALTRIKLFLRWSV